MTQHQPARPDPARDHAIDRIIDPAVTELAREAVRQHFAAAEIEAERLYQIALARRDRARDEHAEWDKTGKIRPDQVPTIHAWAAAVFSEATGAWLDGRGSRQDAEDAQTQQQAVDGYLQALGHDISPEGLTELICRPYGPTGQTGAAGGSHG